MRHAQGHRDHLHSHHKLHLDATRRRKSLHIWRRLGQKHRAKVVRFLPYYCNTTLFYLQDTRGLGHKPSVQNTKEKLHQPQQTMQQVDVIVLVPFFFLFALCYHHFRYFSSPPPLPPPFARPVHFCFYFGLSLSSRYCIHIFVCACLFLLTDILFWLALRASLILFCFFLSHLPSYIYSRTHSFYMYN